MSPIFIRLPEVMKRTGLSRSSIYDLIKQGAFPAQIGIGVRSVAWLESDVAAWIQNKVNGSKDKRSAMNEGASL